MSNEKKQDKMKEVFIFVLLSALIVIRFLPIGEDNTFIKSVGYIGVLFSLVDLYVDADRIYGNIDKFNILRGICYLAIVPLAVILVLLLTGMIPINATWSDVFTLLALLVSLPENLYLTWIEKYLTKEVR
jgi:hypothetical protein